MMPRDVATRWNSSFEMLEFSLKYQPAIEAVTSDRKLELRKYELGEEEWDSVQELGKMLKVSCLW